MSQDASQLETRLSSLKKRLANQTSSTASPASSTTSDPVTSPLHSSFPSLPDSPEAVELEDNTTSPVTSNNPSIIPHHHTRPSAPHIQAHPLANEITPNSSPLNQTPSSAVEPTPDEEKIPIGELYRHSTTVFPLPPSDPNCVCAHLLDANDWRKCTKCQGGIDRLVTLSHEMSSLRNEVAQYKQSLAIAGTRQDESTIEMSRLRAKLDLAESQLQEKSIELKRVKKDLEVIGEKLIDEIEKRAELQHSKEAVQDELEELTKSLFEEANQMVANEARQRHQHQEREVSLKKELESLKKLYNVEQEKVKELRLKLSFANEHVDRLAATVHDKAMQSKSQAELQAISTEANAVMAGQDPPSLSIGQRNELSTRSDLSDELQFQQFKELLEVATKMKMTKLVSLIFMRNALEDDVTPCLRFGGNPRTSTKKFIDAIISNTCFVEEMTPEQIQYLKQRDAHLQQQTAGPKDPSVSTTPSPEKREQRGSTITVPASANQSSEQINQLNKSPSSRSATGWETPPTQSLFNKTVFERLTQAIASANLASLGSAGESLITNVKGAGVGSSYSPTGVPGCSACSKQNEPYQYHFKISDISEDQWYPICLNCRDRLIAVCDFYNFIRNIRQGLYASRTPQDLYIEALSLKRRMFYARLGLKLHMPPHKKSGSSTATQVGNAAALSPTWDGRSPFLLYAHTPSTPEVPSKESNESSHIQQETSMEFPRPSVFEGTGSLGSILASSSLRFSSSMTNLAQNMSATSSDEF